MIYELDYGNEIKDQDEQNMMEPFMSKGNLAFD